MSCHIPGRRINSEPLNEDDGATIKGIDKVEFVSDSDSEALVFDLL